MVEAALAQLEGHQVQIVSSMLIYVKKYHFYHGPCMLPNGKFGSVFFFDDILQGLLAVSDMGGHVHYMRLTGTIIGSKANPVIPENTVTD